MKKVWIVTAISPFVWGANGNKIVGVFADEEDADQAAMRSPFMIAAPYAVTKKTRKKGKMKS